MTPTLSATLALDACAEAGESPWWSAAEDCLYWVDIHGRRLHRFNPRTGDDRAWTTPDLVTFVAPHEAGGLVVAPRDRVCHVDLASQIYRTVAQPPLPQGGPLNDATIDARGRMVIGAMTAPDDALPSARPAAGGLFTARPGVHGIPLPDCAAAVPP